MTNWKKRHESARRSPMMGYELALDSIFRGIEEYCSAHRYRYGSFVGEDYVLGPEVKALMEGFLGLLNGESGRLDCGILDKDVRKLAKRNKITLE